MCSLIRNTHPNCIYYTTFSVKMQRFFFVQTWIFSENKKTAKLRYDFAGKSDLCLGHGQALAIYPYNSVVHCLIWWQHRCLCDLHSFSQNSFTDIYLTNAKTHGIIIKLSHESESWENKGQREQWNGSGDRQGAVGVVQEKFTWQNVWSVVEWMGWLFWTGCRGKGKENMEWTSVHKMFTWQNRQNVIK